MRGERGPSGDHGQDGLPGKDGRDGLDAYNEPERLIAAAIATNRLHLWDKRLLIIFAVIVGAMAMVFLTLDRELSEFRRDVITNCQQINKGNEQVNGFLRAAAKTAETAPGRTPAERRVISERYRGYLLPISDCPPS